MPRRRREEEEIEDSEEESQLATLENRDAIIAASEVITRWVDVSQGTQLQENREFAEQHMCQFREEFKETNPDSRSNPIFVSVSPEDIPLAKDESNFNFPFVIEVGHRFFFLYGVVILFDIM